MDTFDPATDFFTREKEALHELEEEIDFHQVPDVFSSLHETEQPDSNAGFVLLNGDTNSISPNFNSVQSTIATPAPVDSARKPQSEATTNGLPNSTHKPVRSVANDAWREQFNRRLALKDEEEAKLAEELEVRAKQQLEGWYAQYNKEREVQSKMVRDNEKPVHGTNPPHPEKKTQPTVNDSDLWQSVCGMCDFQDKQKDTTRMRDIVKSLKSAT